MPAIGSGGDSEMVAFQEVLRSGNLIINNSFWIANPTRYFLCEVDRTLSENSRFGLQYVDLSVNPPTIKETFLVEYFYESNEYKENSATYATIPCVKLDYANMTINNDGGNGRLENPYTYVYNQ